MARPRRHAVVSAAAAPEELRRRLRAERRSLDEASARTASEALARVLSGIDELRGAGRLATYLAADGELDPNGALDELRGRGWTVHLPVVHDARRMTFVEWDDSASMQANRFGISEPVADDRHHETTAEALDVVLVPCVAVDLQGNRVGMGAGFYDRALAGIRDRPQRPTLIGIAHDGAVFDALEPQSWDVPLDLVVTDRRVVRP